MISGSRPDSVGGGEVAGIVSDLHMLVFILQNTTNIWIYCGKIIDQSNYLNSGRFFLQFRETWRSRAISGRLGRSDTEETKLWSTFLIQVVECLEHNHDKYKNCNFGIFDKMDVLQHNLAGAQSYYVQSTS